MSSSLSSKDFNPSKNEMVDAIKGKVDELADVINQLPPSRRRSIAITNLETCSMFAVKSVFQVEDN